MRDLERTIAWHRDVAGVSPTTFGEGRHALMFGDQKINLHEAGRELEPKAATPLPGSADLCFILDEPPGDLERLLQRLGVPIELGPVRRSGAIGATEEAAGLPLATMLDELALAAGAEGDDREGRVEGRAATTLQATAEATRQTVATRQRVDALNERHAARMVRPHVLYPPVAALAKAGLRDPPADRLGQRWMGPPIRPRHADHARCCLFPVKRLRVTPACGTVAITPRGRRRSA